MTDNVLDDSLKWSQKLVEDTSICRRQLHYFSPDSGVQYNTSGNITINIHNSDDFYYPSDSYLEITGKLVKAGTEDTAFAATDVMGFTNYGVLNLFTLARYCANGTPIEQVPQPGVVATILGLTLLPNDYKQGLFEGYYPDTFATVSKVVDADAKPDCDNMGWYIRRKPIFDASGNFQVGIPLSKIFGFAEDYQKVIYGLNHSIVLTKGTDSNNALYTKPGTESHASTKGDVKLSLIRWVIPRVDPSDVTKYTLMQQIENRIVLDCGFRMREYQCTNVDASQTNWAWRIGVRASPEKPRFIMIAFQTNLRDDQDKNNSVFSHCKIQNISIMLNNDRYPLNDFTADFTTGKYTNLYWEFMNFRKAYYGIDPRVSSTSVDPLTYKELYPIFCFDVTRQSERLKSGVTDISLSCTFKEGVAASTVCHAVIISDRRIKFQSNGSKMTVLW